MKLPTQSFVLPHSNPGYRAAIGPSKILTPFDGDPFFADACGAWALDRGLDPEDVCGRAPSNPGSGNPSTPTPGNNCKLWDPDCFFCTAKFYGQFLACAGLGPIFGPVCMAIRVDQYVNCAREKCDC